MVGGRNKVCLGVVTGAHGIRGDVRVKSFTADPDDVAAYGPLVSESGARSLALTVVGHTRGQIIARVEGVRDRNAAEALKGLRLYVDRTALPPTEEDEYYHADLIGLPVERPDGTPLGTVRAVHDHGAGDMLEVAPAEGGSVLVPFTRAAVPVVDIAGGRIVAEPLAELGGDEGARRTRPKREKV